MTDFRKIQLVLTVALTCLLIVGAGMWWSVQRNVETFRWVIHTQQVIDALDRLMIESLLRQTGTRGFVITGDERFIEQHSNSLVKIQESIDNLKRLTRDDSKQQRHLELLEPLIKNRIEHENKMIELRRSGNADQAVEMISSGQGKKLIDQIHELTEEFEAEEDQHLLERNKAAEASGSLMLVMISLVGVFSIGLIIFSGVRVLSDYKKRELLEAELDRFFTDSMDMMCISNTDGYCKRANPAFAAALGWSVEEILARPFIEFVHLDDRPATVREVEKLASGQPTVDFENRYECKDGSWKTLLWRVIPQPNGSLNCVCRDITQIKATSEALRASEAYNRSIVESNPDCLKLISLDGRLIYMTNAGCRIMEVDDFCAIENADWLSFWKGEDFESATHAVDAARAGGHGRFQGYCPTVKGNPRWWDVTVSPIFDANNKPEKLLCVSRDITERKHDEEKIIKLNADLVSQTELLSISNKELESFSYSVSHDLRAPLRHVQGYVELLAKETAGQLSDKALRHLNIITDASREMGQLIDDLLSFSRMSRTELHAERVDLDGLVKETISRMEMDIKGRNIIWKIPALPAVLGDVSMLRQLFVNLINNAVKYSRPRDPAVIEIGCAGEENGRMVFFVKDNGAGFDMKYIHKLFGVFQRLHRAEDFEGTGIGLAIVQRIIIRHGGRVWAEGQVNQGAIFYFTLKPFVA